MKAQTKRNLGNIFGSLVSNQKAIDGAKESPWWIAIIFLLFSIFLPVIPSMVTTSKTDGATFLSTATYNQDNAIVDTSLQYLKDKKDFKFFNGDLKLYVDNQKEDITEPVEKDHIQTFTNSPIDGTAFEKPVKVAELRMVYVDGGASEASNYVNSLTKKYYRLDVDFDDKASYTEEETKLDENKDYKFYIPSVLCFYRTGLVYTIYGVGSSTAKASSYSGSTWNNTLAPKGLLYRIIDGDKEGKEILDNISSYSWETFPADKKTFITNSFSRLKTIFTESYLDAKGHSLLITTFLYMGIYLALVLIMGLMIFILTRGKNNVFNYLKIFTCLRIAMWASFTPALLGLILGFVNSSFAVMSFIIIEGIRIMWLSMKQLRPQ